MIAEAAGVDCAVREESELRRYELDSETGLEAENAENPEAGLPPAKDSLPPAKEDVPPEEGKQRRRRRVPSGRNRDVYRQVKICERSERDVAREFGLTQPRIFAICRQVRLWNEENGGNRADQSPEAAHNLAVANARLRLSHTFSEAAKWLEVSGQPTQTERIAAGEPTGEVIKKSPNPKPAFLGHMLRAAIELAKLEGAYDKCPPSSTSVPGASPSSERGDQRTECRVVIREAPRPRSLAELTRAYEEWESRTHPEELLSARGAELAFAHLPEYRDEHANELRASGCGEETVLEVAARRHLHATNNYYRAVAEIHAPPGDPEDVDLFCDTLVGLDMVAAKADALARNQVLGSARDQEGAAAAPHVQKLLSARRLHFLEMLLAWDPDLDVTDEAYDAAMNRYRPETGRFDWQLDTGRRDLSMLLDAQLANLAEIEEEEAKRGAAALPESA